MKKGLEFEMSGSKFGLGRWTTITKKVDPKNTLNDLTGREWTHFIRSIILTTYQPEFGHSLRKEHYANKPPSLCKEFIEFFTKATGRILDPFMGVGGTLIGASLCEREAVGIEINREWIDIYFRVCEKYNLPKQKTILGDCLVKLKEFPSESFDFVLTDPPYFYTATERTSTDNTQLVERFSLEEKDIGNISDYNEFLNTMGDVFAEVYRVLKKGKYLAFFMKNRYIKGKFLPISYDLARRFEKTGFEWRGEQIWFNKGRKLFPFGYPYQYIVNTVHHNIEVLRKPI